MAYILYCRLQYNIDNLFREISLKDIYCQKIIFEVGQIGNALRTRQTSILIRRVSIQRYASMSVSRTDFSLFGTWGWNLNMKAVFFVDGRRTFKIRANKSFLVKKYNSHGLILNIFLLFLPLHT